MSSADAALRVPIAELEIDDELLAEEGLQPTPAAPRVLDGLSEQDRTFTEFADFEGVTFNGPVLLRGCKFQKGFSFKSARFLGPVTFSAVSVAGTKGNKSIFDGATFQQSAKFNKGTTLYLASFAGVEFAGKTDFRAKFNASAKFQDAKFRQPANFAKCIFNGAAHFTEARFESSAEFTHAEFKYRLSHAGFKGATFSQFASFEEVGFCGHADFTESKFLAGATFRGAEFSLPYADGDNGDNNEGAINNEGSQGDLRVLFKGAVFQADDHGQVVTFEEAKFGDHNFRRDPVFDQCRFLAKSRGAGITPVSFRNVGCLGSLSLRGVEFGQGVAADFSHARIEGDLDLADARFQDEASFEKARFSRSISLADTQFERFPDFRQAVFNHQPELYQCHLPQRITRLKREYRQLLATRIGALRRIAVNTNDKKTERALLIQELKLEGGVATKLYGLFSNYGQSWFRPAAWLVLSALIVFPLLHILAAGTYPRTTGELLTAIQSGGPACIEGEGNALAAAMELSLKNALIVGADNEIRSKRVLECLGTAGPSSGTTIISSFLETGQMLATLVLVFFIGTAARRRLQVR